MTAASDPRHDLAHLGHHALHTPAPDETVAYFVDLLGMDVARPEAMTFRLHRS